MNIKLTMADVHTVSLWFWKAAPDWGFHWTPETTGGEKTFPPRIVFSFVLADSELVASLLLGICCGWTLLPWGEISCWERLPWLVFWTVFDGFNLGKSFIALTDPFPGGGPIVIGAAPDAWLVIPRAMPLPIPSSVIPGDGLRGGKFMLSSSFKVLDKFAAVDVIAGVLSGALRAVAEPEGTAAAVVGTVGRTGELIVSVDKETAAVPAVTEMGTTGTEGPRFAHFEGGVCGAGSGLLSCETASSDWSCDVTCEVAVDTVGWKECGNNW
jgi:hypothetical protein